MINVIDKKQMYDSVITGKENVSKESVILLYQRFWWILKFILCLVMHVLCVYALKL